MPVANHQSKNRTDRRRQIFKRWLLLWPITLGFAVYPVSNGMLRLAVAVGTALLVVGLLVFYWRNNWLRNGIILFLMAALTFIVLPGKNVSAERLRGNYVRSLRSFEGSRYIWGGENKLGIDCSGLVRAAMINSLFAESVTTFTPAAARRGLSLWWQDCSARALGEEYQKLTTHLFDAETINQIDHSLIQPGDLAVTADGLHVLAYLGAQTWIQADPDIRKVIVIIVPSTNTWFDTPVKLMRWRILEVEPR